ncbi:hypothetical protein BDB01DRAFT_850672 [Pilobolus umbonatus]|nr:hypothetical protein BDB01DRAFT_850672 [Pilobolus umbonatus]
MTTLQVYAHRLSDPKLATGLKVTIANELRDQVEIFQTAEYSKFLSILIPVFYDILQNEPPVFTSDAPEQKLRNIILEIIYRLPQTEALKEYVPELCATLLKVLRVENEDNAVVCVKIIIDLHRSFRHSLEDKVQPFLDIVQEIFQNMEQTVKNAFENHDSTTTPSSASSPRPTSPTSDPSDAPTKLLAKSMYSFKVLTECPIIVVLLFQSYRRCATENIMKFISLIFQTLRLQAMPQVEAAMAAEGRGEIFIGVSPAIKQRQLYNEFIVAQVKTMSFLAYILRSYTPLLKPYQSQIPDFVLRLLRECPAESSATRKELLVATRHILSTDFRISFVSKIDLLMNEKVLIGSGVTAYDTLRPLAYSMLADLIHHIRTELSPSQISRTIHIYSRNLHDPSLASSIQTMCGKLLLNLIDCIMKIPDKEEGRRLLMRILEAFTSKFEALNIQFDTHLRQYKQKKHQSNLGEGGSSLQLMDQDDISNFDFDKVRPIHTPAFTPESPSDGIKEGRFLFKNLAIGLKPLFIGLRHCNPSPPGNEDNMYTQFAKGFTLDDIELLIKLFKEGIKCFEYYNVENYGTSGSPPDYGKGDDDWNTDHWTIGLTETYVKLNMQQNGEKEILDTFSIIFTLIDPAIFQEIFVSQIDFFYERIIMNTSLINLAQFFLVTEITTQGFTGILLRYLVNRIEQLGQGDLHHSAVMLHLFRLVFMAVNLFSDANEEVLQPYLANLVMSCFKLASKAKKPANYFLLLKALFKSIGGGRFELLYKEVSPLLQIILENLNSLVSLSHKSDMRNLFVELCLAVPVRLSTLLPYLPYLMRPLVIALQADPDLVTQGLRTMELCNDNLNPEFLDHIMAPVITELMDALRSHLKPLPYSQQHSHAAMRILGKLGGRNRRMLKIPPALNHNKHTESKTTLAIKLHHTSESHILSLDSCLKTSIKTLESDSTLADKQHAYNFLKSQVIIMLDLNEGTNELTSCIYQLAKELSESELNGFSVSDEAQINEGDSVVGNDLDKSNMKPKRLNGSGYVKYISKRVAQEDALKNILVAIIRASVIDEIKDDAWSFFCNICNHFMLLHIGETIKAKRNIHQPLGSMMAERLNVQHLNGSIIAESIVEIMFSSDLRLRKRGEKGIHICYNAAFTILRSKEAVNRLPIFRQFALQFCSCCYKLEWYKKRAGCLGISIFSSQLEMHVEWMREHELDFIKSLLFVLKDANPEMANINTEEATHTLSHVLKVCNSPGDVDTPEVQQKFQNLISLLLSELSNSNGVVRETIQSSFQLIADLTGNEVTELLAPVRDRLVAPIFAKPLRALPFAMQIGNIDAITYCLTLRPPFLEFNDELIRLLHEALALADAEDQALVSRSTQYKSTSPLMNLRVVCIRLLSAALACSDFSSSKQGHTRARIIQVFFKSLYSKSSEVVEAAHRGLKQVLAQPHKLPKELLQQGLRPILTTLSNHKTLSAAGLEGLARLLELLTHYFKVEIGRKLLDHLRLWAEPRVLQEAAGRSLTENYDIKIIVAILNIFHLLPSTAHMFLDEIVTIVIEMESNLRRAMSSPFRPNLIKFLVQYPSESVAYFYEKLSDNQFTQLFIDVLKVENSSRLREEVINTSGTLIRKIFDTSLSENLEETEDRSDIYYHGVNIIYICNKFNPEFLMQDQEVLNYLLELWHSDLSATKSLEQAENGPYKPLLIRQIVLLAKLFISYLQQNEEEVNILFEVIKLYSHKAFIDLTFLHSYLQSMLMTSSTLKKHLILEKFLSLFSDEDTSSYFKMIILRYIVNPALLISLSRQDGSHLNILDTYMMEQLNNKIWTNLTMDNYENNQYAEDSLRIELLQMTAMIVQYDPQLISDRRKEIIKFGWNYLKLEDATSKQAAYVLIAHFIAAYDTPSKIIIQIYAALLRAHSSEARILVKQGLDIITPILRLRIVNREQGAIPTWVRLTRKVVVEDTHSISQMVNVYQLFIRHSDLFFEYREHFLPQIANTLPKLGLVQNATPEHKMLTVELVELILKWEQRRIELQSGGSESSNVQQNAMDIDSGDIEDETMLAKTSSEYVPSLIICENIIGYLVRLACMIFNPTDLTQKRLVQKSVSLIKLFLTPDVWPDVYIRPAYLERSLLFREANEMLIFNITSALELLFIDITHRSKEWFSINMGQLHQLLEPSVKSENVRIQVAVYPIVEKIMSVNYTKPMLVASVKLMKNQMHDIDLIADELKGIEPLSVNEINYPLQHQMAASNTGFLQPDVIGFIRLIDAVIKEGLINLTNIYGSLRLLQAASNDNHDFIDPYVPGIIKILHILTKEHTLPSYVTPTIPYDSQITLLILCLSILQKRVSYLGEQHVWFFTFLIQLVEHSSDTQLLKIILDMVNYWLFNNTEPIPTIREKAILLTKLMSIESRNNIQLTEQYFNIVLHVFNSPQLENTELPLHLKNALLQGCCNDNPEIRSRFMKILDRNIGKTSYSRLAYILEIQNWEPVAHTFWLHQAIEVFLSTVSVDPSVSTANTLKVKSIDIFTKLYTNYDAMDIDNIPQEFSQFISNHQKFLKGLQKTDMGIIPESIIHLQYFDDDTAYQLWVDLFAIFWLELSNAERNEMEKAMSVFLSKDYHMKQSSQRPNVIQALLEGVSRAFPSINLSPYLVRYLGKTFNCWHIAVEMLQKSAVTGKITDIPIKEQLHNQMTLESLTEMYTLLHEEDMFYGLWRRRSVYAETNKTLSCEQCGLWQQAQQMYENIQGKIRNGINNSSESESNLWENHWVQCTSKLQQWDILSDFAKHDNNTNLLLECAWRLSDWTSDREHLEQSLQKLADFPTPRLKIFECFLSLIKSQTEEEQRPVFNRVCEEGAQLALRKWHALPHIVGESHLPLLQIFQEYLELSEASQIFKSLSNTNAQNLEQRSAELRSILVTWRERLPNMWDDINVWSDLVAWRQHIFSAINRTYLPLISSLQSSGNQPNNNTGHSYAYRGYHETAWIINRFSHVARKHQLYDVCINYLSKIYTLPNIEIQEAFLKLREQAKCYYLNPNELTAGLDVINNTNLMYFTHPQKAEFFTLKGMFLAKLQHYNEANEAYVNAVQIDMTLPRAWAEWGKYNDRRFRENPKDISWANSAVSCYLQASGLYKNAKARKHLLRILWLLSLDDQNGSIGRAVENYKGEWPVWYWITFIPQLLTALQHREGRHARSILVRITKQFPQALNFQLRTAKEDMQKRASVLRANMATEASQQQSMESPRSQSPVSASNLPPYDKMSLSPMDKSPSLHENFSIDINKNEENTVSHDMAEPMVIVSDNGGSKSENRGENTLIDNNNLKHADPISAKAENMDDSSSEKGRKHDAIHLSQKANATNLSDSSSNTQQASIQAGMNQFFNARGPLANYPQTGTVTASPLDEIMSILKTGYPLLALSMETMVDQIQLRFKPQADEDMYRLVVALYNEGAQQLLNRLPNPKDNLELTSTTITNIHRFADSLYDGHMKTAFVNDFAISDLNLEEYIAKLRIWRDKFEAMLDSRQRKQKLESYSHYLVEFQHQKFDDVEIPGQYLMLKNNATDFLRIDRFLPEVELIRSYGNCYRRLSIRGHDGSIHPFVIQNPVARQFRREERLMQLFRMLNYVLERRKESRIRNLVFHLPAIVPLAPNVRMVQDDPSYVSLYDIYEDHCDGLDMHKDDPLVFFIDRFKQTIHANPDIAHSKTKLLNFRIEINDYISSRMVPSNIISSYLFRIMRTYTDYWMLRKRFTTQYAMSTLMSYIFSVGHRMPHKIMISRKTGNVWMTEFLPGWNSTSPLFGNGEAVPFRFTPNIQEFMTPVGIEGLFSTSLMTTASCLTEPEFEIDQYLCLFVRDELATWHLVNHSSVTDVQFRERINTSLLQIQTKIQFLSCKADREKTLTVGKPLNQNVIDLISQASNSQKTAQMESTWMPWL